MILPKHLRLFTNILLITFSLSCSESDKSGASDNKLAAIEQKASQGDLDSQLKLLCAYRDGVGIGKDPVKAFYWATKAADQKDSVAQHHLGISYTYGKGTKKDLAHAFKYFKASAEQGYPQGEFRLGICYLHGKGVTKDDTIASVWLVKAANHRVPKAQIILGDYYYEESLREERAYNKNRVDNEYRRYINDPDHFLSLTHEDLRIKAYMWYNIASSSGDVEVNTSAKKNLNNVSATMSSSMIRTAQSNSTEWQKSH